MAKITKNHKILEYLSRKPNQAPVEIHRFLNLGKSLASSRTAIAMLLKAGFLESPEYSKYKTTDKGERELQRLEQKEGHFDSRSFNELTTVESNDKQKEKITSSQNNVIIEQNEKVTLSYRGIDFSFTSSKEPAKTMEEVINFKKKME